ncbi:cyclic nucleotide-binding domain-containing protein [Allorhizobium borbori]|uniref:CRP-like cAMP-binding protein n=1 Tax=Allorhizobium borbori TaxID=485907 RepID=A0A7W6P169_9HYPH|nr:cyclic nucleotide-binding domain-containing protein [Allorhizobium borbori]MBB4103283.1 CRP-like cAMP-binding protein [Allorhizobium borbori]PZU21015.1 MAG: cyclic nucleotide-binding protein [Shinella sp.]
MILDDEVRCLRSLPFFASADPSKLKRLAFTSDHMRFAPGQVLFHEGDPGDAAYVILSGTVDVSVETPQGPIKVATADRNSIIGEIALLNDGYRTATVTASAPLETLRIDKHEFLNLMKDCPSMMFGVLKVLSTRLTHTTMELAKHKSAHETA